MKVLFLANIPSPYRVDFFNELGKECELTVTFEGKTATDRNESWKSDVSKNFKAIYLKGKRITNDSFFCPGILEVLREHWDKIIVGVYSSPTSMLAIEYMRLHKQKFYIEADGGIIQQNNALKYKVKRHFISSASGWLSSGKKTTEYLAHYGADKDKCYLYPFTSLTKSDLEHADQMRKEGRNFYKNVIKAEEEKIILSVGSFHYDKKYGIRKGFHALIRAAEKISDNIGIYIVGEDPPDEFLEWKKKKELKHVHFIGFKTKEELTAYYAAADLFVLMTKYDIWGLVINEAMSFGLPIITTDKCVAGLELVRENINGYIVPVDDDKALVEKIMLMINDEGLVKRFGKKSREVIQRYSIENMAEEHINILKLYQGNYSGRSGV